MQVSSAKNLPPLLSKKCGFGLAAHLPAKLFKALSDPKRLSLFVRLAECREPRTVGEIAQGSGVHLSVVSRHVAALRDAGVVQCEKRGKAVYCRVPLAAVAKILRTVADALEACCPDEVDDVAPAKPAGAAARPARRGKNAAT